MTGQIKVAKRNGYLPLFASTESVLCGGAIRKRVIYIVVILLCALSIMWLFPSSIALQPFDKIVDDPLLGTPKPGVSTNDLGSRLQDLLIRPILSAEGAAPLNHYACPSETFGRDESNFFERHLSEWSEYTVDQVRQARERLVNHIFELIDSNVPVKWSEELLYPPYQKVDPGIPRRGIIYSAGKGERLERLKVSLSMLRHTLRSTLPIEIFHFIDELDEEIKHELVEQFGGGIVFRTTAIPGGSHYGIKNRAFIETSFIQFVWMDSDTIPLVDPNSLFDSVEFTRAGNVWWADVAKDHPENLVWRVLGQTCKDKDWTAETGQVVFDKRGNDGLNLAALHLAAYMIQDHETWGMMSWGDKDTFRYAFYALGLDYQMAPRVTTAVGQRPRDSLGYIDESAEFCGYANLHWGLTPISRAKEPEYRQMPAFLHANVIKIHSEVWDEDFPTRIRRPLIDKADDARLLRTPCKFDGACLKYDMLGPYTCRDDEALGDGQGMVESPLEDAWRDETGQLSEEDIRLIEELRVAGQRVSHITKGEF